MPPQKNDAAGLEPLQGRLREMRGHFENAIERHRSALWHYCLRLTGSAWDAEDLVQETLLRAFAHLPRFYQPLDARAYLFRIASNAWIDVLRRARLQLDDWEAAEGVASASSAATGLETRAAMETLVRVLPPRQRVVVLLVDAFDFKAVEVGEMLETSEGAVRAALHRARETLRLALREEGAREGGPKARRAPPPDALVERYLDAFNARDPDALVALLAPAGVTEIVGDAEERGRDVSRRYSLAEWAREPEVQRAEFGELEGRPVVYIFTETAAGEPALSWVITLESTGGRVTRQRLYYFCPEFLRYAASLLGVPAHTHGYQYVPPGASQA